MAPGKSKLDKNFGSCRQRPPGALSTGPERPQISQEIAMLDSTIQAQLKAYLERL